MNDPVAERRRYLWRFRANFFAAILGGTLAIVALITLLWAFKTFGDGWAGDYCGTDVDPTPCISRSLLLSIPAICLGAFCVLGTGMILAGTQSKKAAEIARSPILASGAMPNLLDQDVLLRASDQNAVASGELLRPTQVDAKTDPDELLRASSDQITNQFANPS